MMKVYNTLSRKKEIFKPLKDKNVNLFVCGPTVYDLAHLGHAKTYVAFDVIVKYLRQQGYKVFYLQNVTNIDDKIIKRAKEKKISPEKLAISFERDYFKDIKDLKIDSVTKYARATRYIKEIISQVDRLLKKKYAYQTEDGIYYDISKFKNYGKLSRRTVLQAEDGISRIDESVKKRNKGDFCLWKFSKLGEPKWKSPWQKGRPGWHIEDTAITEKYFGSQYDIHGGGKDLIFPHHEAEIAQMEAISGKKPMVKYWLHVGFLTVEGRKMAKSLGNFITIKDFLETHGARALRLFFTKSHYRSPIDYNDNLILQTKRELERIDEFISKITSVRKLHDRGKFGRRMISQIEKEFKGAMEDDFNTPKAVATIFKLINKGNSLINENKLTKSDVKNILEFLKKVDKIFNFIFWEKPKEKIDEGIIKLVKEREKYRKRGDFKKADEIRKKIEKMGFWIEDTKEGSKIKKIN